MGVRKLWATLLLAALVVLPLGVVPTFADEIEPEPEPATKAEPAPEPEPRPEPQPEPKAKPAQEPVAKAERAPEDDGMLPSRWIPSIETGFETFDYNVNTTVQNLINPPAWASTQKEASRQLMYRIGGEVMSPAFDDLPGKPRLFVQGGVQLKTFSAEKISALGDPSVAGEPQSTVAGYYANGNIRNDDLPIQFPGQGNEVYAEFQRPSWYAGLGVAFSVPIADNLLLQLKPSLQYSLEKIDMTGAFGTVNETTPIGVVDPDPCGTNTAGGPCLRTFEIYQSQGNASTTDRSLGAGMEVALALFRKVRPIRVSLYAEARFMWLLNGSATPFIDPQNPDVATYSVSRDKFGIKGGGGVRLSWVGFE